MHVVNHLNDIVLVVNPRFEQSMNVKCVLLGFGSVWNLCSPILLVNVMKTTVIDDNDVVAIFVYVNEMI